MAASAEPVTVLHVDDDQGFLDLAARALERADERLTVISAASAADGLARLYDDASHIDCVVSDFEMPQMDGLEFLVAVRSEFPDQPFVLFTGKGTEAIASKAISVGVTDYLQKGTGIDQFEVLANRLGMYVERARERSRLAHLERELAFWKEHSPAVVIVDPDRRVRTASAPCRDLFQVDALDELVGTPIEELVHPAEREAITEVIESVQLGAEAVTCEDRGLIRTDGETVRTTVQWRAVNHWGEEALLAVMNDFPVEQARA